MVSGEKGDRRYLQGAELICERQLGSMLQLLSGGGGGQLVFMGDGVP